jgi:hypothetical protein
MTFASYKGEVFAAAMGAALTLAAAVFEAPLIQNPIAKAKIPEKEGDRQLEKAKQIEQKKK